MAGRIRGRAKPGNPGYTHAGGMVSPVGVAIDARTNLAASRLIRRANFLGLRNTGGYAVAVISAAPEGDQFVVVWSEARPAPGAIVIQALTDPYVVRVIPHTTLPVTFRQSP